jgi:hypothetical protein
MNDKEFLYWIVDRLTNVLGENPNADFIHRLRDIANKLEFNDIITRLERLIKPEFIDPWLNTPNKALDNEKPIDLIHQGDTQRLHKMLYVLESGEPLW